MINGLSTNLTIGGISSMNGMNGWPLHTQNQEINPVFFFFSLNAKRLLFNTHVNQGQSLESTGSFSPAPVKPEHGIKVKSF
jgi:hypothetical protein